MRTWFANQRLSWAIFRRNEAQARAALAAGASLSRVDRFGNTPLHAAVRSQCVPIACLLMQSGADVFASSASGETAVEMAVRGADLSLATLLATAAGAATLFPAR